MRRILSLLLIALALPGSRVSAAPALPFDTTLAGLAIFPETGHSMRGELAAFWRGSGGLPVFGLPISAERRAGRDRSQLFERARIEWRPANPVPYQAQLGLLGAEALRRLGRDWRAEGGGEQPAGPCRAFETGREVCGPFLDYWERHGLDFGQPGVSFAEALALFGLPLTAPRLETNRSGDRVLTQWFERARFELHPANPPAHRVLLGRLGAEAAGEPATPGRLAVAPPSAAIQGRAWSFGLPDQGYSEVSGLLGGWPLSFARAADGSWLALGGVSVLDAAGPIALRVSALRGDGSALYGAAEVMVEDGGYRSERIVLPPEVNESIARNQDRVTAERAMVNAIWPQVSAEKLWRGPFALPAEGRVSSEFGTRRAYNDGPFSSYHEGLDIANAAGTPVRAANRGRVALAESGLIVRGGAVIIDHGLGVHTGYWHMQQVLVRPGQLVEQGELIGLMGAEGMVTGAHLHWDLRVGSLNLRPQDWIARDFGARLP